jgi:hypothetical protein
MISKELMQLLRESDRQVKAAKTAIEDSSKTGMHFVNLELDLSLAFAERALASFSAGRLDKAKRSASAAKEAYRSARKFFHKLSVTAGERKQMQGKLAQLEGVMGKLSGVKLLHRDEISIKAETLG